MYTWGTVHSVEVKGRKIRSSGCILEFLSASTHLTVAPFFILCQRFGLAMEASFSPSVHFYTSPSVNSDVHRCTFVLRMFNCRWRCQRAVSDLAGVDRLTWTPVLGPSVWYPLFSCISALRGVSLCSTLCVLIQLPSWLVFDMHLDPAPFQFMDCFNTVRDSRCNDPLSLNSSYVKNTGTAAFSMEYSG